MINEKLQNAFNDQINKELYSEYLYLAMKTYFMEQNLMGFVNWFDVQVQEEHAHAMGMFDYLNERGGTIDLFRDIEQFGIKTRYVKNNNGTPPQGYKGGKIYSNKPKGNAQKLPDGVIYKEYDVNPHKKGVNRGEERIVIGDDGSVWYTDDHYETFQRME